MPTQPAPLAETTNSLRNGDREPRAYIEEVCDRVAATDPVIRALRCEETRRHRLRDDARTVAERWADEPPPLYGVPVGVKDIIHVDGFTTRAGSAVPPELFQGPEAAVVSALRDAGAVILGKTVTTEFAGSAPGLTRNPHDIDHTPGGSSSGSAAAVAAGMCPLAIGTQTGGSVIRPAAFCGIVGFKPTYDRISTDGVIPRSETLDHVGVFTQDVAGMAIAASVVCADWTPHDPDTQPVLGVPTGPYLEQASPAALDAFDRHLDRLDAAGYTLERVPLFAEFEATDRKRGFVADGELAQVHADWIDDYEGFYRTTSAARIRTGQSVTTEQLTEGRAVIRERRAVVEDTMDEHGIDVWVSPAAPGPAPAGITTTGDPVMNRPWTDAGVPAVTVPAGTIDGLPIGLQCATRSMGDEALLAWAGGLAAAL